MVLICGWFFFEPINSTHRNSITSAEGDIAGYFLTSQGQPELRRGGKALLLEPITSLRNGDEIRLAAGVSAQVITPRGAFRITGPKKFDAEKIGPETGAIALGVTSSNVKVASNSVAASLRTALFRPVNQVFAAGLLVTTRESRSILLYSPAGATRSLTPLILWKTEPGKTYEVSITDEFGRAAQPWRVAASLRRLSFQKLKPGKAGNWRKTDCIA